MKRDQIPLRAKALVQTADPSSLTAVKRHAQQTETTVAAVVFSCNYEQYLRRSIDSLLEQHSPFDQVLVVDDGSTDGSRAILESYGDRIQTVYKENSGQLGAAVFVLEHINTSFVYFLDADDFADADASRTIRQHLAGNPVKVQFQLRCVDNEGFLDSVIPAYRRGYNSADMIVDNEVIGFYTSPPTSGNVFSVRALRSIPLDQLKASEPFDGSPMLCMPYLGEVRSVRRIIASYRLHGANRNRIHGANDSSQHAHSVQLFTRDLDRHRRRWQEVISMIPAARVPPSGSTLLEREAHCLRAVLSGERLQPSMATGYVRQLMKTSMAPRLKFMLSVWMLALVVLPSGLARRAVFARRSPVNRHFLLKKLLSRLLGVRSSARG